MDCSLLLIAAFLGCSCTKAQPIGCSRSSCPGLLASAYCGRLGCSCTVQPIGCSPEQRSPSAAHRLPFPVFSVLRFRRIRVSRGLACSRVWCPSRCPLLRPPARSLALGGAKSSWRRLPHPSPIDVGGHSWAATATSRGFCHPFRRSPPLAGVPRGDGEPARAHLRALLTLLCRSSRPAKIRH